MVKEGDALRVERLETSVGEKTTFDAMLVMNVDGTDVKVGTPLVKGAKVVADIASIGRHDKVIIIKYHPKTRYKRKAGHRQHYTELKITSITA